MASLEKIQEFLTKMKFMYIETPPEIDPDYEHFAKITDDEYTPEKCTEQNKSIRDAFRYYGDTGINWILAQRPAVKTAILNDTVFMNIYNKSRNDQERKDTIKLLTLSMQIYGGFT